MADKLITRFIVEICKDIIYSTNFDQCHVTKNHKDYTTLRCSCQQKKRSPLSPQTVNSLVCLIGDEIQNTH